MATTYFWVAVVGATNTNWGSTPVTNWALTSGGIGGAVGPPTTGDAVVFDSSSGSGVAVMEAAYSLTAADFNGFTGTWTQNAFTLTVSGNDAGAPAGKTFRLSSGMTYTPSANTRLINMTAATGTATITTAGKTLGALTLNGAGTFELGDALTIRSDGTLTHTQNVFDDKGFAVSTGLFVSNGSTTRSFSRTGAWTLTAGGSGSNTVWAISATTKPASLTVTSNTGSITISGTPTGSGSLTFQGAGQSYGAISVTGAPTGGETILFQGTGNTFASFAVTAPNNIVFNSAQTHNITAAYTLTGSSPSSIININSSTPGSTTTISIASGAPTIAWGAIQNVTGTGGATFTATNSFDLGGNSGITITGPGGGVMGSRIFSGM